jgi:hypothetical protein
MCIRDRFYPYMGSDDADRLFSILDGAQFHRILRLLCCICRNLPFNVDEPVLDQQATH